MGKDGIAYLFVCPDQGEPLTAIENLINKIVTPMRSRGLRGQPEPSPADGPRAVQ